MESLKRILFGLVFAVSGISVYVLIAAIYQPDVSYAYQEVVVNTTPLADNDHENSITSALPQRVRPDSDEEVYCLALNIYHEARGSTFADQVAVTDVVLNRVYDHRYPNTVCEVVHQAKISQWHLENTGRRVPVRNQCQFSWHCNGRPDEPNDHRAWRDAQYLAYNMYYYDYFRGITEGATHYHATHVSPFWAPTLQRIGQIGSHIYYKWQ